MYPKKVEGGISIEGILFESDNVRKAYDLASKSHEGQVRKSGEPYFNHCVEVAKIIRNEWGITNDEYLNAGLLHDSVEDTSVTIEYIRGEFGNEVADLVEGVTKLTEGSDKDTLAKVLSKTYLNPGVAVIKLADRLHNMRTLGSMSREKQIAKSSETVEVYTKLAESLGIWQVKIELEDLCFKYLEPENYEETKHQVDGDKRNEHLFINYVKSGLEQMLSENGFEGKIEPRKNGYRAIKRKQRKMAMLGKCNPDSYLEINDLISLRVKVKTIDDCYHFLRILHENFGDKVDFDRYDEFIGANRRINGYEAIQTTLSFLHGPVEVAIVTEEMEDFNKWGVVNLIKIGSPDLKDYVLKMVFTPSGNLRFMSRGATGVDFAALVNPRILAEAEYIMVDGKKCPVSTVLPNASTVEVVVLEGTRRAPLPGLEEYCMPQTRKLIQEQRMQEKRDGLIQSGKKMMEVILTPRGLLDLSDLGEIIKPILFNFGCQGVDDLHFMIGNGSIRAVELEKELDRSRITKNDLGLTTIKLTGKDHPGILIDVAKMVSRTGSNITHIEEKNQNDTFILRIIIKGLRTDQEKMLRKKLGKDIRFDETVVV
ncbi:MAG: HD domain-containing protein [Oligoflexia bacterium]|nr:HD domain-containing protein [Oligoflexia bacterium]